MRRLIAIATLLLLPAAIPARAQHGGGHASAGGHGGIASHGGFAGHSAGHAFGGSRSGPAFASHSSAARSFAHPPFAHQSFAHQSFAHQSFAHPAVSSGHSSLSSRGFRHSGVGLRLRTNGFGNCFGYACRGFYGYPWFYSGLFDPYWWGDSGSSYDQEQQDEIGLANQMNAQSLDEQKMPAQNDGDQDAYARSAPPVARQPERTEALPATVLVFRDRPRQEVQNYAIVGQTLWIFAPPHTQKIPLSELDVDATQKANDERGVDFRLPGAGEGQ